jgi:hypothetical protein
MHLLRSRYQYVGTKVGTRAHWQLQGKKNAVPSLGVTVPWEPYSESQSWALPIAIDFRAAQHGERQGERNYSGYNK